MIEPTPRHSLPQLRTSSSSSSSMDTQEKEEPSSSSPPSQEYAIADFSLGFGERAISAAGAAFLSAIIVNPLDVVKTRLQAQAAGVPHSYSHHHPRNRMSSHGSNTYSGTLDVFYKVIRQEGFGRLWRGTNAALALAIPTVGIYLPCYDIFRNWIENFTTHNAPIMSPYAPLVAGSLARSLACISCYPIELARTRMQAYKESGLKPPGLWKTLLGAASPVKSTPNHQNSQCYRTLWTGLGAQLARDVPFSAICWSTLEPIRRKILSMVKEDADAVSVIGANFSAGFLAGSLAAFATCPFDVAKTRRQIEKDPARQLNMTTWKTLGEIWRDGKMKGLFTGVIPRVARAGPSVGIVISFYEVVKYGLHRRHSTT